MSTADIPQTMIPQVRFQFGSDLNSISSLLISLRATLKSFKNTFAKGTLFK